MNNSLVIQGYPGFCLAALPSLGEEEPGGPVGFAWEARPGQLPGQKVFGPGFQESEVNWRKGGHGGATQLCPSEKVFFPMPSGYLTCQTLRGYNRNMTPWPCLPRDRTTWAAERAIRGPLSVRTCVVQTLSVADWKGLIGLTCGLSTVSSMAWRILWMCGQPRASWYMHLPSESRPSLLCHFFYQSIKCESVSLYFLKLWFRICEDGGWNSGHCRPVSHALIWTQL